MQQPTTEAACAGGLAGGPGRGSRGSILAGPPKCAAARGHRARTPSTARQQAPLEVARGHQRPAMAEENTMSAPISRMPSMSVVLIGRMAAW